MRYPGKGWVVVVCVAVAMLGAVWAQESEKALPKYDVAAEVKLKGGVEEVREVADATHVMLRSGTQLMTVYVAPSSFLKDMECAFAKGDDVEIIGSKVKVESGETVLAREITRGQLTLTLRDKKGAPVWMGWKRG